MKDSSVLDAPDFRRLFESAPVLLAVFTTDFRIVAASDVFLAAAMTTPDQVLGRNFFDVFPDNPNEPNATGATNLRCSLERVLQTKQFDQMPVQKYDVRRPASEGGEFVEKYWSSSNSPVVDEAGKVQFIIHLVEDVTDRVLAEKRAAEQKRRAEDSQRDAREAHENLEQTLANLTDSFYRFDKDFRYTYVNRATIEMFGIAETDFLGKTLWDLFPDVEGNLFHRELVRALETQESVVFENYYEPLDRWFENRVYPSKDGISVFTHEITRRKRSETALRRSEEKYRALFDSIDAGFCVLEVLFDEHEQPFDFRYLETNLAFETQSGAVNVTGKTVRELFPDVEQRWFEIYGKVALTGESIRFTDYARAVRRWYDMYAFRSGAPEERKVAVLFNDITERKQAEEEIRRLSERNRDILESIDEAFFAVDRDWRFTYVNHQAETVLDRKPGELIGKVLWDEYPGIRGSEFEQAHHLAVQERVVSTVTAYYPDHGRWYESNVYPAPNGITVYFKNVTERKQAEETRERLLVSEQESRREAEEANRLKDEFLAMLSHELRTPLNAILGWAQMLRTNNLSDEEKQKALATIERNARAQNQLIDDLLDISRIITGKLRLDVQAVDLANVIAAAVDAARPATEAKNIRLQLLLDPMVGAVSGDADRLQQIVWNLLSNAVKFTPKNGRVQVRLERVNSHVEIVVSDTGRGIEPQFLPFVFERFRQSDGSTTRRHGGLGLGLAIARQLVELHGGTISAASAGEGQGATFTVSLPLLPVRIESAGDNARASTRGSAL